MPAVGSVENDRRSGNSSHPSAGSGFFFRTGSGPANAGFIGLGDHLETIDNPNTLNSIDNEPGGGPWAGPARVMLFFLAIEVVVKMIIKMVFEKSTLVYVCGIL